MKRIARVTEPQFALIVLLVCAPILLGLCLILLGWIDAALDTITDLLMAPADKPWIALLFFLWLAPIAHLRAEDEPDAAVDAKPLHGLFLLSIGALIGLSAARMGQAGPPSLDETLLAYAAMGMSTLHLLLLFIRPSPTLVSAIEGALIPIFLVGLLSYIGFVRGDGIWALSILGAVVAIVIIAWLAGRRTERIDYTRH